MALGFREYMAFILNRKGNTVTVIQEILDLSMNLCKLTCILQNWKVEF